MKEHCAKNTPSSSASEPEAVYAKLSPEHHVPKHPQKEEFHKDSMSVDEYCNILHQMVDDHYDSIQG